jgi:hypothetical protein
VQLDHPCTGLRREHGINFLPRRRSSGVCSNMTKHLLRERCIDEPQDLLILGNPHAMDGIGPRRLNDSTIKVPKEPSTSNDWNDLCFPQVKIVPSEFLENGLARLRAEFDMAMVFRLAMVCFGSAYLVEIGQQHQVDVALCVNIS